MLGAMETADPHVRLKSAEFEGTKRMWNVVKIDDPTAYSVALAQVSLPFSLSTVLRSKVLQQPHALLLCPPAYRWPGDVTRRQLSPKLALRGLLRSWNRLNR